LTSGVNDCCWSFVLRVDTHRAPFSFFSDVCLLQIFLLPWQCWIYHRYWRILSTSLTNCHTKDI